jgi:hypothetical protein
MAVVTMVLPNVSYRSLSGQTTGELGTMQPFGNILYVTYLII